MRDITLEDTFYQLFTTRAFATGIPTVLAGTPVVSAYENEGLTQITAGITLGVDHDGVVGLNLLTVVGTAANGYENGKDYGLVITTGTVDSVSVVGEIVAEFTVGRSAAAVDLANGTDGLGAIKTDTAATLVDTGEIGTAGAGLTDLGGMSTTMKAQVNTEVVDVVNVDTLVLPGQAAPSNTPTMRETLGWLYKNFRNRKSQTATTWSLYADNETTVDNKATVSDDATTAIKQEVVTGP